MNLKETHIIKNSFEKVKEDINSINQRLKVLSIEIKEHRSIPKDRYKSRPMIEEKMAKKIRLLGRDKILIENEIIKQLEPGKLTTTEIEDIIVKEKGYCSRASFYNHIRSLTDKGIMEAIKQGKNRILKLK